MKDSKKQIQNILGKGCKFGAKPHVSVDELHVAVPSSREKKDHLKRIRQDYVDKLTAE